MMLPTRISVSVTPAAVAGGAAAGPQARKIATDRDTMYPAFLAICIDAASNIKLTSL
jgi:hypothetical protein